MDILARAGLDMVAQYGVRVFSDYLDAENPTGEAAERQMLELESILGVQPEFAANARYARLVAHPSRATE